MTNRVEPSTLPEVTSYNSANILPDRCGWRYGRAQYLADGDDCMTVSYLADGDDSITGSPPDIRG